MNKKEELKNLFLQKKHFPHFTGGNEELGQLLPEFADWDGYVAGLVTSYIDCGKIGDWKVHTDDELTRKLRNINPRNEPEKRALQSFIEYKEHLDKMMLLLRDILEEDKHQSEEKHK